MIRGLTLGGYLGPVPWPVFGVLGGGSLVASVFVLLLTFGTAYAEAGLIETGILAAVAASLLTLAYARRRGPPSSP